MTPIAYGPRWAMRRKLSDLSGPVDPDFPPAYYMVEEVPEEDSRHGKYECRLVCRTREELNAA